MIGDDNKLDNMLRSRLEQHMPEPSPEIWENIRKGIAVQHRQRRLFFYRLTAAAAVLLLALITGVLVMNDHRNQLPVVAEKQTDRGTLPAAAGDKEISPNVPVSLQPVTAPPAYRTETANVSMAIAAELQKPRESAPDQLPVNVRPLLSMTEIESLPPVLPGITTKEWQALQVISRITTPTRQDEPDRPMMASFREKKRTREGRIWEVGLHLAPDYSSYTASHAAAYARNMTFPADQTRMNIGGGISLKYAASGKWRIESGLYYSRTGDVSGNNIPGSANMDGNFSIKAMNDNHYVTAVDIENGQVAINSTAGVIRFSQAADNAAIFSKAESAINLNSAVLASGNFSQVFDFMEIPLDFRYKIMDKTIGVELIGGISTSLVVGNNVWWENASGKEKVGTTSDISPLNFAGIAGIGTIYSLSKNLSLSVEPRASYFLNSINNSRDVDFRPWKIGVFTGLTYRF